MLHLKVKMEVQKNKYDPRFYFIAINNLTLYKQPKTQISLLFTLGTKRSESKYSIQEMIVCDEGYRLTQEAAQKQVHLLKYGAEEFLNIYVKTEKDHISYSRILLPPIFELPHTRHNITVKMHQNIFQNSQSNSQVTPFGELNIDIYFQFDFSGDLDVIPVSAHLQRNIAQVGQMKPRVRLQLQQESWTSLEAEGGIHPHWTGHFHANRNSNKGLIDSIEENLKSNKLDQWARLLKMATNSLGITSKNEAKQGNQAPYFDCTQFTMRSAGSYLKVEIISDPFIGSKPDIIGTASIRVGDEGLLKYPRKPGQKLFQQKLVHLFHFDEVAGQNVPVGVLKLYVRFVFDKEKVIKKNRTYSLL